MAGRWFRPIAAIFFGYAQRQMKKGFSLLSGSQSKVE
jgi:hypothetical protein